MTLEEYLLIAIGAVMLFVIYYVTNRDAHYARQMRSLATALEELNRQLYKVEKKLNERIDDVHAEVPHINETELRREFDGNIRDLAQPIAQSLHDIEQSFGNFKNDMEKRIHHLEDGIRNLSMPASVSGLDDEKIISLYKQGVDLDTIARELRLSKAEVEFVLKINKIR